MLWVTLTSSPSSDASLLTKHHKEIVRLLGTALGFSGVEYSGVVTREGHGVIHVVWAWKGRRSFYVDAFKWLSPEWERLHGARMVSVQRIRGGEDRGRVARYAVAQYVQGQ